MAWVVKTLFPLSVLNVGLNTLVIVLSYLAGILATWGARNLLLLRLKKHGTAPILSESGNPWRRLNLLIARVLHRQSPTRLLIVFLSSVVLLIFEVSAEFGVDSSSKCTPRRIKTSVGLCATPYNGDNATAKNIASSLYTQQMKWDETSLVQTPILEGFRKNITGTEAFLPDDVDKSLPVIVRNCSVDSHQLIPANTTRIELHDRREIWNMQVVSLQFKGQQKLQGSGDLTGNQNYFDAFFVATPRQNGKSIETDFYDYTDSVHIYKTMSGMYRRKNKPFSPMTVLNQANILKYILSCAETSLTPGDFEKAIQVYRSTQLERKVKPLPAVNFSVGTDGGWIEAPKPLMASDVVKAVIALKLTDEDDCEGETFEFTDCGTYDIATFLPVLGTIFVLLVIALMSAFLVRVNDAYLPIPTTAVAWSRFAWLEMSRQRNSQAMIENSRLARRTSDGPPSSEAQLLISGEDVVGYLRNGERDVAGEPEFVIIDAQDGTRLLSMDRVQ